MQIPDIVTVEHEAVDPHVLGELADRFFVDMVKYVADVRRGVLGCGEPLP